jgi:hypothetical protein
METKAWEKASELGVSMSQELAEFPWKIGTRDR